MKDKIKEINITEVTNGYMVRIGCCVFVFKQDELIEELTEYIREPHKTEKRYIKEYEISNAFTGYTLPLPGSVEVFPSNTPRVNEEPETAPGYIALRHPDEETSKETSK